MHAGRLAGALIDLDPGDHRVGSDLGAAVEGVRDVGDQRRRLGVDLAPLQAEPAVDAVRTVAEPAVADRDRTHFRGDAKRLRAAQEDLTVPADRVRSLRIGVRIAPRPVLTGNRQLGFDRGVVRPEFLVADRPVRTDTIAAHRVEVTGMKPRGVAGVVDHRAADPTAGVVRPHRDRVRTGDHPRLGPVQVMRPRLIADPVRIGVPERAGVQPHYLPAGPGQPLQQR